MNPFEYEKANSIEDASAKILQESGGEESRLIAGGTALVIMLKENILSPKRLVDISQIEDLRKISFDETLGLKIGSMATHLEIESSEVVSKHYPALKEAFHTIGNVRVRAVGTIGGNLAYAEPQCNPPTILSALNAEIIVKSVEGERTIPAERFIKGIFEADLQPGEIISHIIVPPPMPSSTCTFFKFTQKSETDKPTSVVAIYLQSDPKKTRAQECRIVVGAVGPKTFRCKRAEEYVKSHDFSTIGYSNVSNLASEEFEVMDDLYGPSWYKKQVTKTIIEDSLRKSILALTNN